MPARSDMGGQAGGESLTGTADEVIVQFFEELRGIVSEADEAAHGADQSGNEHGCGQAFSGDVAQDEE